MSAPYKYLSKYYENIINDGEYCNWLDSLACIVKNNAPSLYGIDCACGTGLFTRKLKKLGASVTGVDISEEMLTQAKFMSQSEKLFINFLKGDIRTLKSFKKCDFITCVNDGINYVKQAELGKVFDSFSRCLNKGGILLFDVSSEYKLSTVLNNNVFGDDGEDLSYIWINEYDSSNRKIDMYLSFFEKNNGVYKRYNEVQTQYVHTYQEIVNCALNSGFSLVSATDENGEQINKTTQRIVFLFKK